jgi:RyR domain-containing protein
VVRPEQYRPSPIETSGVALPPELDALTERLAEHVHDLWALGRMAENWTWGEHRSDEARTHPCLVPYARLSDGEKEYDRTTARKTLLAVIALGYRVIPPDGDAPAGGEIPGDANEAQRGAR